MTSLDVIREVMNVPMEAIHAIARMNGISTADDHEQTISKSGRHKVQRDIIEYAIQRLIEVKHPTRLLIYGEPLWFDADVDVVYKESRIQKLRKIRK